METGVIGPFSLCACPLTSSVSFYYKANANLCCGITVSITLKDVSRMNNLTVQSNLSLSGQKKM